MAVVVVTVRNRIATIPDGVELVCNNPSDVIQFDLDSEWDAHVLKTARFSWQRKYEDKPFNGNEVNVPDIDKTTSVEVGIFADNRPAHQRRCCSWPCRIYPGTWYRLLD